MKTSEIIFEVVSMKQSNFTGDEDDLWTSLDRVNTIQYKIKNGDFVAVSNNLKIVMLGNGIVIRIYVMSDSENQPVGIMELHYMGKFPVNNVFSVYSIAVDRSYRGRGIAKAMYSYAMNELKVTLMTGDSQTPGGQRNWVALANMPGVEVTGWAGIDKAEITASSYDNEVEEYRRQIIDDLMGKIGAQYIGEDQSYAYFEFPVEQGNKKVENLVKRTLIKIYPEYESDTLVTGLLAKREQ